jgi:hypothetical protein
VLHSHPIPPLISFLSFPVFFLVFRFSFFMYFLCSAKQLKWRRLIVSYTAAAVLVAALAGESGHSGSVTCSLFAPHCTLLRFGGHFPS